MANARNLIFSVFVFILTKSSYGSTTETQPSEEGHVVNSTEAAPNSAPFIVSIQFNGSHICTGSILNENWVVAPAHCLDYLQVEDKVMGSILVAGSNSVDGTATTTQKRSINYYVIHDLYTRKINTRAQNDIGLVYTATPFTWSNAVAAISLPASGTTPSGNAMLYGWHRQASTHSPKYPSTLQVATVPIITNDACESELGIPEFKTHTTNICTGGVGKCIWSSGAPLVQQTNNENVLIAFAVLALGGDNCSPAIHLLVSSEISWISANKVEPSKLNLFNV